MSYFRRLLIILLLFPIIAFAQKVTLNFKDLDIKLLVDTVAEITNKTFIVDPRVKGNVTVVSSDSMDHEQVYQVFLSILSVHGFAAVENGSVIKIIPQNIAKSENIPVIAPSQSKQGDSLVTQIIQVNHVSAAQLIPILRPLIPQQGHLVAYPPNNSLIISDSAGNVDRLTTIIRRIDKPDSKDVEIISLNNASATEVARIFNSLEQKEATASPDSAAMNSVNVIADERTNSLLISGQKEGRLRLRALVSHLDTPLKNLGNTQVVYLKYARSADLVGVLDGVINTSLRDSAADATVPSNDFVKTSIQADESTNSLVITASPDILQNLQGVIRKLDIRRAQVLVEAIIAEISTDKSRELGVQWILDGRPNGTGPIGFSNFDNAGTGIVNLANAVVNETTSLSNIAAGAFLGLGRFNSENLNFGILLQALSSDSKTNVLSTPSLLTLDNQQAEISVGQNVPFITGQYTAMGSESMGMTSPFQTIERHDIGIKLIVTPQINEGNSIKLDIEQEVSSVSPSKLAADIITNKRRIKTTVVVEDGNMIVLGGLIDEDLQETAQKVPVLGDIPLLGALFRSNSTSKVKRNLMIFLHPTIVRDENTETLVSSEKYNYMRNVQLESRKNGVSLLEDEESPVLPDLNDFLTVLPNGNILLPANAEQKKPINK